jgi:hypothetical protein
MGCAPVNDKWVCYANNSVYTSQAECEANCSFETSADIGNAPYATCSVGDSKGIYVCKVALYGNEVRAVSEGSELNPNQVDIGETNYEYRPCEVQVDSNGQITYVCPLEPGEEIVKDCTCDTSDEALKAISTIEMLNEMSHDIICSSSPP